MNNKLMNNSWSINGNYMLKIKHELSRMSHELSINILCVCLLLFAGCRQEDDTIEIVPARHWVEKTVAVVAPIGDAATKARLERTADWFLQNFREAQMLDTLAIDLKIEWHDELSEDMTALSEQLAGRDDICAVIGPFGNDPLAEFAPACYRTEKPLIAPTTTSEEIVRRYAVASATGQRKTYPFLWALTESDVKLVETLITGFATMMHLFREEEQAAGILVSPDDAYGTTFNYWAPFFAQNYNLDLAYNGLYSSEEDMTSQINTSLQENADKSINMATLCVVETADQLYAAARAHRQNVLNLLFPERGDIDAESSQADTWWQILAFFFRPYFVYPNISEEAIAKLGDKGSSMLQGYQGYSPYADPSTGYELAYKSRFGTTPTFAECKFYDALMLAAFAINYAEHQGLQPAENRNRQMNEAIITITAPSKDDSILSGAAWNPSIMQTYLKAMEEGRLYHFVGASADISFDPENYTATTHTTYVRWQIFDGKIVHGAYFGEEGNHSADATAAWKYLYSQKQAEQDFADYTAGAGSIDYPALTDQYAVLVQGSQGFTNYRHQADVLSMYQLLRHNGYDDDHIILILDDALSTDEKNPEKGIIRATRDGKDLLGGTDGLPKAAVDYDAAALTATDIANILLGNANDRLPVVLPSDKGQNVFFYWSGHGRSTVSGGANEFCWRSTPPGEGFTSELLRQTASDMLNRQQCRKMLIVAEPCYGEGVVRPLEGILGVLAITGSSAIEQSWADNWSNALMVWRSDRFTQNVVDYLYDQPSATYRDLFLYCAQHTLGSHAKIVNAARFGNLSVATPQEFIKKQ